MPERIGYLALLRSDRRYRDLCLANIISLLGDWLDLIALAELLVNLAKLPESRITSAAALAGIMIARFLPNVIFGPTAGNIADRYPRHQVMRWANLVAAVLVLLMLPFLTPQGIPVIIGLTFLKMGTQAFYLPANQAAVPMIIPQEHLTVANALGATIWSVMLAVGAVAGAVLVQCLGPQLALVLDALTFVIANFFLLRLNLPAANLNAPRRGGWADFLSGLRFLRQNSHLGGPLLVKTILGISGGAILYPLLAEYAWPRQKPDGALDISYVTGVLYFAFGLGTLIGPLLMRRLGIAGQAEMFRRLGLCFLVTGGFGILFPLAATLELAFVLVVLSSMGRSVLWVYSATLLQLLTPDSFRGRVFAVEFALMTLGSSVAILISQRAIDQGLLDARGLGVALGILAVLGGLPYFAYLKKSATHGTGVRS